MDTFKYVMMSSVQRLSRDPLLVRIPCRRWRIHQEGSGVQRWEGGSRHWALSSQLLLGVTGAWLRGATLGAGVARAPQLCSPRGQRAEVAVHQVPPVIARGLFLRGLRAGSGRESLRQRPAGAGSGAGVRWSGRWETGHTPNFIQTASPVSDTDNHIFPYYIKCCPKAAVGQVPYCLLNHVAWPCAPFHTQIREQWPIHQESLKRVAKYGCHETKLNWR